MKKFLSFLLLTAMLGAASVSAAAQEIRIGFINTDRIFKEANTAKQAQAKLEQEFSKREKELNDLGFIAIGKGIGGQQRRQFGSAPDRDITRDIKAIGHHVGEQIFQAIAGPVVEIEQHIAAGDDSLDVFEALALERPAQIGHRQAVSADVFAAKESAVAGHCDAFSRIYAAWQFFLHRNEKWLHCSKTAISCRQ